MKILLIIAVLSLFVGSLFLFARKLENKQIEKTHDTDFQPLVDELKSLDHLEFQVVSSSIMYSKIIAAFLKVSGYFFLSGCIALLLDLLTTKNLAGFGIDDLATYFGLTFFIANIFFIIPLLSFLWNYTYFQYGLDNQIKNIDVITHYLKPIQKRILKNYPVVFLIAYFFGRVLIDSGLLGVLAATDLYLLIITIYFSLELKRLGLAPALNLISEKTKLFLRK